MREEAGDAVGRRDVPGAAGPAELAPEDEEQPSGRARRPGAEIPKSAKPIAPSVDELRRLTAEMIPIETPKLSQSDGGADDQEDRAGRALQIRLEHGRAAREGVAEAGPAVLVAGEERLDEACRTARTTAWSRPRRWRISVELSGVGFLPAKRRAGSPAGQEIEDDERDPDHARRRRRASRRACEGCRKTWRRPLRVEVVRVGRRGAPPCLLPRLLLHRHLRVRGAVGELVVVPVVTVGPTMVTLFDQRYGTHGTTSVISFLSRFSQHALRSLAGLADAGSRCRR